MGDEVEVRREDQDKINSFSRLHQKEIVLEEELKSKNVRSIILYNLAGALQKRHADRRRTNTEGERGT